MYWAVPVFLMITGALMLGRNLTYSKCLTKYVKRTVLVLTVFGMPFAFIKSAVEQKHMGIEVIFLSLRALIENKGFGHMWYLYMLIGIYLVLPILQLAVSKMKDEHFIYLLGILILFCFIFPIISEITGIKVAFALPFTYPLFYLFAGYYMHSKQLHGNKNIEAIGIALIACFIFIINYLDLYPEKLTAYNSPLIAVMALLVFRYFRLIKFKVYKEKIWKIDRLCFGVYLIHPLFIQCTYRFFKITPVDYSLYYLTCFVFFLFFVACSFLGSWILNKVPIMKKIL